MSAILSADDLNDFISPGVACIKPVETLPARPEQQQDFYEVTTEDKIQSQALPPAQISLTDCLACSGCVTSAETVLINLQNQLEVLSALDKAPSVPAASIAAATSQPGDVPDLQGSVFVASVSPQSRASLAATYRISEREAGHLITQLLSGPDGLANGGKHGSHFTWVIDTNICREVSRQLGAQEVIDALQPDSTGPAKPILSSACPGWICYAEKTQPHVLPHLSRLKSPQALTGTLLKSVLSHQLNIDPSRIWHLAIMPCFDKKLEASRAELTDSAWREMKSGQQATRDVDCVITTRELIGLAEARGIDLTELPRTPLHPSQRIPFPHARLDSLLFPRKQSRAPRSQQSAAEIPSTTSGSYLTLVMATLKAQHPDSTVRIKRGRNSDVCEYNLEDSEGRIIFTAARYYGSRNIQNLVRKLKPAHSSRLPNSARRLQAKSGTTSFGRQSLQDDKLAYVEVMACPGGCTNGGGQVRVEDAVFIANKGQPDGNLPADPRLLGRKQWLEFVDETYFSADDQSGGESSVTAQGSPGTALDDEQMLEGDCTTSAASQLLDRWSDLVGLSIDRLTRTSYHQVESDVGNNKASSDQQRVAELASALGGKW